MIFDLTVLCESQYYGSTEAFFPQGNVYLDTKQLHFKFNFMDESSIPGEKANFSVTCYFAKEFYELRRKCCQSELDVISSLGRCHQWEAQGGKSNVYFAKSMDQRFIFKQVTKTELESFEDFAPQYFKYLAESIASRSPTCLAKILGVYQVILIFNLYNFQFQWYISFLLLLAELSGGPISLIFLL